MVDREERVLFPIITIRGDRRWTLIGRYTRGMSGPSIEAHNGSKMWINGQNHLIREERPGSPVNVLEAIKASCQNEERSFHRQSPSRSSALEEAGAGFLKENTAEEKAP